MLDATNRNPDADGRATRWDAHKAQRRHEVLDGAVAAIEEDGPAVGVQHIADRVGLPRSVVYRHFQGRSDLDEQVRQRIIDALMAELAPTLRPDGTPTEAIQRAVDAYLGWIERHPRLHAFLGGGSGHTHGTNSRVVSGTKTAIAVQVADLLARVLRQFDKDTELSTSLAFGLVGLVDASVNNWLADRETTVTTTQLAAFLARSLWLVLDGNLRALGVEIDPDTPISELLDG